MTTPNVTQAVPFLMVTDMKRSLDFYVYGLGFKMTKSWEPDGIVRWCWLELDSVAIMLQQYLTFRIPTTRLGDGVTLCFQCQDSLALFHRFTDRHLKPSRPFVGNALWVVGITDPDGYILQFSAPADCPEETLYPVP